MPVDTAHPEYVRWATHWRKMSDVMLGQEGMEQSCIGPTLPQEYRPPGTPALSRVYYLPKLEGQTEDQYVAYVRRAQFYNATARTVEALVGAVFRRDPVVQASGALLAQLEDVTLTGVPLATFAQDDLRDELRAGQYGILIDYPETDGSRPYWVGFRAEDVLCCEETRVGGQAMWTRAVLRESAYQRGGQDGFGWSRVTSIRELLLIDGAYVVRVYRVDDTSGARDMISETMPTRRGEPVPFIPFFYEWPLRRPPLLDLADVNISHYRKSADYAHGLHFTALPTPWIADQNIATGQRFPIGSEAAWTMSEQGSCGMLEFSGAGLGAIREAMLDDEVRMAHLGAELLMPDKRAAEAADTLRIRSGAKTASLAAMANRLSWRLTKAAQAHAWWIGESDEAIADTGVTLNTDFVESRLDPQELTAWVQARQAGEVTRRMFLDMLASRESLGEQTVDEALVELEAEGDMRAERDALKAEAQRFKDMAALVTASGGDPAAQDAPHGTQAA